jgi:hypothetical protein
MHGAPTARTGLGEGTMSGTSPNLEARLEDLARAVARLEGRVAALEKAPPPARRPASAAPARTAEGGGEGWDAAQVTRILSLGGRTLLVLAGAFVLRALTDSGRLPAWMGVALGFAYAGIWIVMADRAGHAGQALSAGFHAVSVVIIGFPLLFEGATRFKLFSPPGAAAVLAVLSGVALLLASRRGLQALAWVVSLGGIATALALMAASGRLVPGALYLVLLGVAALWIGYVRDWTALRWPVALVADLVVVLVAIHAGDRNSAEGPGSALLVQSALVACYLGSFATRTLYMGRKVVPFEMVQTGVVIVVGIGGAVWVAVRSGMGQVGFGITSLAFGVASYAVAFAFVERRQKIRENFYFYTSVAVVFLLAGTALLLGEPARSLAWAVLALGFGHLARRRQSRTMAAHSAVYAVSAAIGVGLVGQSAAALFVGSAVIWRPGGATVAVLLGVAGSAWQLGRVGRDEVAERLPAAAAYLALALGATGVAVAWLAPLLAGTGADGSPGALATLRTGALVVAAVVAAWMGREPAYLEAGWLAYPLLGITGLKVLLEDLPRGRPATLILGFACYGLGLILVPRIRARRGSAGAAPAGGGEAHPR